MQLSKEKEDLEVPVSSKKKQIIKSEATMSHSDTPND